MNLRNIRLASKVAGTLVNRYRELNNEQQRDVYEAVRLMARGDNGADNDGTDNDGTDNDGTADDGSAGDTSTFSAARLQAGDITRAAHARLDRRRAQFEAEQLDKKEKKELEKALKKQEKDAKKGKRKGIAVGALILALLAAIAGAVYYFIFGGNSTAKKAPVKKAPAPKQAAKPTVVHTQPPTTGPATTGTDHGPLSEEPAERDEELLSSIDEQLSTLDTLDEDEKGADADNR
ncbi:hypothetical protein [Corynebacterium sp. P8-C1]|uniref:hypothetical protein n=1 Tax=Corynebacterium sp. P8-C1 TaxID=3059082 RepID=UPI00265CCEBF|nr:hypothetical protein [Corynebacterium sp. P8-C1]WKK64487.1 hypothetical protein QYR04_06705 [Corynebacterium sp. P8-C1]